MKRLIIYIAAASIMLVHVSVTGADVFNWVVPGGGAFENPANWIDSGGLPGVPGPGDEAHFNVFGTYPVAFSTDHTNQTLHVVDDDITLDLQGHVYSLEESLGDALVVGGGAGGSLRLSAGVLTGAGTVRVEGASTPTLHVDSGSGLVAPRLLLGDTMVGTANVGGLLRATDHIDVGNFGIGSLQVDGLSSNGFVTVGPRSSGVVNVGRRVASGGDLLIDGPLAALYTGSVYVGGDSGGGGGSGGAIVQFGGRLDVADQLVIYGNGAVAVDGGVLSAPWITLHPGGQLDFLEGAIELTDSGLTVGSTGLLGSNVTLGPAKSLSVSGSTTIQPVNVLQLSGGSFSTGWLDYDFDPTRFNWSSGTFRLTNDGLTVGSGELLGATPIIDQTKRLDVAGEIEIKTSGNLTVDEGQVTSGSLNVRNLIDVMFGGSVTVNGLTRVHPLGQVWIDDATFSTQTLEVIGDGIEFATFDLLGDGQAQADNIKLDHLAAMSIEGSLSVRDTITVGDFGHADAHVFSGGGSGAVVSHPDHSGTTFVARELPSIGTITIDGEGARWETGAMYVGGDDIDPGGNAFVSVSNQGVLEVHGPLFVHDTSTLDIQDGHVIASSISVNGGANLNWAFGGSLTLTGSDLFLPDVLPNPLEVMGPGKSLTVAGTTTIPLGQVLRIDGGAFSSGVLDVEGDPSRLEWVAGKLELTAEDLTINFGELLGDSVSVDPTKELSVSGTTHVFGFLSIDGGTFSTGELNALGAFSWNAGTFNLTNSDIDIGTGPLGQHVTINPGDALGVSGVTRIENFSSLDIFGGTLTTGSLDYQGDPSRFNWSTGTLNLTNVDLTIGSGELLGDFVDVHLDKALGVRDTLTVAPDGFLVVQDGALTVGDSAEHGGPSTLRVDTGGILDVQGTVVVGTESFPPVEVGTLRVEDDGTLELTGGRVRVATFDDIELTPLANFVFLSGTFEFTQSGLTVGDGTEFEPILTLEPEGHVLRLENGRNLHLSGPGGLTVGDVVTPGEMHIGAGSTMTSSSGSVSPTGTVRLTGEGARWESGTLDLSFGVVTIRDHAVVETDWLILDGNNSTVEMSNGTLIADVIDYFGPGSDPFITDEGAVLKLNQLILQGPGMSFGGDLHVGHTGGLGISDVLLSAQTLEVGGTWLISDTAPAVVSLTDVSVADSNAVAVGVKPLSDGVVTLTRTSHWNVREGIVIGGSGAGFVRLELASTGDSRDLMIGTDEFGQGNLELDGVGTRWVTDGRFYVGGDPSENDQGGVGDVLITGGAELYTTGGHLGREPGGFGVVTVRGAGSAWHTENLTVSFLDFNHWLIVAAQGTGTVNIEDGGFVDSLITLVGTDLPIGMESASGFFNIDGTDSTHVTTLLFVGGIGSGDLHASNNALIRAFDRVEFNRWGTGLIETGTMIESTDGVLQNSLTHLGVGGDPAVTIRDPGTTWTIDDLLEVRDGTLDVANGATVSATQVTIAPEPDKVAAVTMDGPNSRLRVIGGTLGVGSAVDPLQPVPIGGVGTLDVTNGAIVEVDSNNIVAIGAGSLGGDGRVTVSGNSLFTSNTTVWVGLLGGTGRFDVLSGSLVTSDGVQVGSGLSTPGPSFGTVLVDAGAWDLLGSALVVGASEGDGVVEIRNGGQLLSAGGSLGSASGAAEVTVDGPTSLWDAGNGQVTVGEGALLTLSSSADMQSGKAVINGDGRVILIDASSDWSVGGSMIVNDTGDLQVKDGAKLTTVAGTMNGGTALVFGPGSDWTSAAIGMNTAADLTVTNDANMSSTSASIIDNSIARVKIGAVWNIATSLDLDGFGLLNIGPNGLVSVGQTVNLGVTGIVDPDGGAVEVGTPTHAPLADTVQLYAGAQLVGGGDVAGNLVNRGGLIAPGLSIDDISVIGDYTQTGAGTLAIELAGSGGVPGTDFDQLIVTGNATLAGAIDVTLSGGFVPGNGDAFAVLTAANVINTFDFENLPVVSGLGFHVLYGASDVTIAVATLLGDANNDGQVTGADLIAVQQNFGTVEPGQPTGLLPGDANDDGQVTGADLISVQQNFGNVLGPAAVPEPSMLMLLGVSSLLLLKNRHA